MRILSFFEIIVTLTIIFYSNQSNAQGILDCELPQFGLIYVDPDIQVNGVGQNVDSIEFWKAPDSTETLMFVAAKDNNLVEVWKYPFEGNELPPLTHSTFNNSQVNGVVIDQESDLLYVAIGQPSSTVSVFTLPDLDFVMNFNKPGANFQSEPNLTLLKESNGNKRIYVSADVIVYIHDAVTGEYISEFVPMEGLETMAPDSFYQRVYIPDENNSVGIYVYNPDGTPHPDFESNLFGTSHFSADAEGITVYYCLIDHPIDHGKGFIVVSDQRRTQTDFEFFDRVSWEHLGTLRIDNVNYTDGIASFPYPLPDYPLGVFAAIDNDKSVAIVGWDKIFEEIMLTLPVELTSFSASINASVVQLNWSTATEVNNYGFNIERSTDNLNWTTLGFVEGYGNTNSQKYYTYNDADIEQSGHYYYRLKQLDNDGTFEYSNVINIGIGVPDEFYLSQNYPNPFNPSTKIKFSVPANANHGGKADIVRLKVYDIIGNEIATLVNEEKTAGEYEIDFNGTALTSGIYFYQLKVGVFTKTQKMTILK